MFLSGNKYLLPGTTILRDSKISYGSLVSLSKNKSPAATDRRDTKDNVTPSKIIDC